MRAPPLLRAIPVVCFMLLACGKTTTNHPTLHDGGTTGDAGTTGACTIDSDCHRGSFCIAAHCGRCNGTPPLACRSGEQCLSSGACQSRTDGGTSGSSGSSGSTGASDAGYLPCANRTQCPGSEACLPGPDGGGLCGEGSTDAGCDSPDVCPKTFICQAHACIKGCNNNNDCHGSPQPYCFPGAPGHCGACTANTQCLTGENCQAGQCVPPQACTSSSSCGGLGCVAQDGGSSFCGPCLSGADCANNTSCDPTTGKCVLSSAGCTSDAQCQAIHAPDGGPPFWFCDHTPNPPACQPGCTPDAFCAPAQAGCCNLAAGATCSSTTHACTQPATSTSTTGTAGSSTSGTTGGCGSFSCNQCTASQQCDLINCVCVDGTTGTTGGTGTTGTTSTTGTIGTTGTTGTTGGGCSPSGDVGQPCGSGCQCNAGLQCYDLFGGGPYTSASSCTLLNAFGCGTVCN